MPHVPLIPISYPQHRPAACCRGPEVHREAEHVRSEHVVMEAENAVGRGWALAALMGGLKQAAQENGRVLELLGRRGLDVEVVAGACAQSVVLPRSRVIGGSGTLDSGPVKNVPPTLFLCPRAQPMFKVTLQFWSCQEIKQIRDKKKRKKLL